MTKNIFGITDLDLELIIKTLKSYSKIKKAIIFGSRAIGNYKNGSDIDIAISGNNIQDILTTVWGDLESNIPVPYKFDLINLDTTESKELSKHIEEYGIELDIRGLET